MLGFIKKDLLILKNNMKFLLLYIIAFFLLFMKGGSMLYFIPVFLSTVTFLSTFSYDDYNKWDAYAITMPNGRKTIVKSKYIANICLTTISIVLSYIIAILIGIINKNLNINEINEIILGCFLAVTIMQAITYPLIFKYGIEKGRIVLFLGVFLITSLVGVVSQYVNIKISKEWITFYDSYLWFLIPIVIIIALWISYKISKKIYNKKEF